MSIRKGQPRDIPSLVTLDRVAYGTYGADENYFQQKLDSQNARIIVSESGRQIMGFVVFEMMEPGDGLDGFSDLNITTPITQKWMHIIAFTTATNFIDVVADSKLLRVAENEARNLGCALFCVPLSINHPYLKNDVFGFWRKNGYKKVGTINWIASPRETIECYFYSKSAGENRF